MTGEELPEGYTKPNLSGQEVPPEDMPENLSGKPVPPEDMPDTQQSLSGKPVPLEDMPQEALSGQEVPANDLPDLDKEAKYSTAGQQALTVAENLAKGVSAGTSTYLEKKLGDLGVPGLSAEDIQARKEINPAEALYSDIGGNVALSAMLPEVKIAQLGKVGAFALKNAISAGLFQTGDELSDSFLGHGSPLPAAASHVVAMATLGGLLGYGGAKYASPAIAKLSDAKLGTALKSFIVGMGHAAHFPGEGAVNLADSALTSEAKGLSNSMFRLGQQAYKNKIFLTTSGVASHASGLIGAAPEASLAKFVESLIGKHVDKAFSKVAGPMLLKLGSSGSVDGVSRVLDSALSVARGNKMLEKGVEGLFSSLPQKTFGYDESSREEVQKLKDSLINKEEEPEPEKYAEGGEVGATVDPVANSFPQHAVLVNAAKSRVHNFLHASKPMKNHSKLAYDSDHSDPQQERDYDRNISLAAKPLSILKKIKKGTLVPKDVAAFNAMYPDIHEQLSKKITERIMKGQVEGEKKPPYKVRQAMSLFLGSNLDSTLSQPNMMAAQMVFAKQNVQKQQIKQNAMKEIGNNNWTAQQAREDRQNNS